ncbi:MAG: cytochrome c3 family protein [Woeseia sp.]
MTQHSENRTKTLRRPPRRSLVMLIFGLALASVVVGCSTEARHRIKNIIFTGVPPLHEEQSRDGPEQPESAQVANAEQMARQQQHREALVSPYWQHGPYAAGECGLCHSLDQSTSFLGNRDDASQAPTRRQSGSVSSRLNMPTQQLCISCHAQHSAAFARERGLKQHLPAAIGACTHCHNPHQSLRQYMLLGADNRELCTGCHNPETLPPVHSGTSGQDCLACHNAHVGVKGRLFRFDVPELTLLYGRGDD